MGMQIADVFVPELNKIDPDISLDNLAALLDPFLTTVATSNNKALLTRTTDRIFMKLLESNVTLPDSSDEESSEEDLSKVDGGKMSKRTRKEVEQMINQKYIFPSFNILIYAENFLFPRASAPETDGKIKESNREQVYDLYYYALDLEPEPKRPELTFTQRQIVNRARGFITKRMKKRQELSQAKKGKKDARKIRAKLSDAFMANLQA